MKIHTTIAVLLSAAVLTSCDALDEIEIKDLTAPSPPTARIKFNNFSVNSVQVNFFANDTKMTAVLNTSCSPGVNASLPTVDSLKTKCLAGGIESATGTAFGGNAAGGLYMGITPGSYTLTARKAATDTVISTVTQTIAAGKAYTFTMSGIYNATTKTSEAFVVEDPLPTGAIDYTVAHIRLINAVPNATGDLTMTVTNTSVTPNTSTVIGGATAYKAATAFFTVPEGTYTVTVRAAGAATDLITRTGVSLSGSRIYTLTARGDATVTSTRALDYLENQR